jgi:hypothetical protein
MIVTSFVVEMSRLRILAQVPAVFIDFLFVLSGTCWDNYLNEVTATTFHIIYSLLFINYLIIRFCSLFYWQCP